MKSEKRFFHLIENAKKRIFCFLLSTFCCCSILSDSLAVNASNTWPQGPEINGEAAVVMDAASGTVLFEKNPHEKLYPASITKILTALLAIEDSRMDEQVTFSYNAVHRTEGSGIWRDVDEVLTMEQCLYALMLNSANECAYAIAEHVGGSYDEFVRRMNDRVEALGCKDTHFTNPHGLPDEQHLTSCYDMALIAREAIQNETFRQITGTKRYQIPPTNKHPDEITYLRNHQKMLFEGEKYYYPYCIGGKTGYTDAAGNTLVTFAEKDGMTLICVTMKQKTSGQYEDSIKLLNYCFDNFSTYKISEHLEDVPQDTAAGAEYLSGGAFADIDKEAVLVLPKEAEFSDAVMEIVSKSTDRRAAATLQYTYAGRVIGTADVVTQERNVTKYPFESQKDSLDKEGAQEKDKEIYIDLKRILLVLLGFLVLAAAGILVCRYRYDIVDWLHDLRIGGRGHGSRGRRRARRRRRRRRRRR